MELEFVRDGAMYGAIFGFFGMSWFGWAQEMPPKKWRAFLGTGLTVSFFVALVGTYLAVMNWGRGSALELEGAFRMFGIVVGVEFALAGLGAGLLAWCKRKEYIPTWVALVVGAHFLPLAWLFQDHGLYILTLLAVAAPFTGVWVAKRKKIAISAVTGALMGMVLLGFGVRGLILVFM